MSTCYIMIGLQGSGKSTWAKQFTLQPNIKLFSSDDLRQELYKSSEDQTHNNELFNILENRILECLKSGCSAIYDATNINSKQRRNFISKIKKYTDEIVAILMATPYAMCLERNRNRGRVVPDCVIEKYYKNFNVPCKQEGFDAIEIVYPERTVLQHPIEAVQDCINLPHDNPHHSATIGQHMFNARDYLLAKYKEHWSTVMYEAVLLHDIGKPFTKSFINSKGETTPEAHYYNHNNVGAYESLFIDTSDPIKVALLIQYHMNYYMSWKQSQKAKEKDIKFLGEDFMQDLDILHDCDIHAK